MTAAEEEPKYKTKRTIQNGVIRYQRVEITDADIIIEKENEIKRLHELIDTLRNKIEILEAEQQRRQLIDQEAGPAESYSDMYK
jgi:hypothetical protein